MASALARLGSALKGPARPGRSAALIGVTETTCYGSSAAGLRLAAAAGQLESRVAYFFAADRSRAGRRQQQ